MLTRRLAFLLAVLLLIAGAARTGWMAGHQPVLGYANQYDMGRTSACLGLWPDLAVPARYEAHREAPVARYVEGEHRPDECYFSSELLFSGVALAAWKLAAEAGIAAPGAMDLRYVGTVKALALVLLALAFTWLLRERSAWLLAHALVFAVVLADPVVTLWLNTLYTEFAAVYFAYMALVCMAMIVGERPDGAGWYVTFGVALLGLGLSRQQHALLPLCLLLLAWPALWQNQRRSVLPLAAAACAAVVLQAMVIVRPPTIAAANNVNVVLGTLLPAAKDQPMALVRVGLPQACGAVIDATWYLHMGESLLNTCPDILTLPKKNLVGLLLAEPMIALRALMKAAPLSQPALLQYVGIEAGRQYVALNDLDAPGAWSIAAAVERLPLAVYLGVVLAALAAFVVSLLAALASIIRTGSPALAPMLGCALGGTFIYAVLTSVFGDGLVEFARHSHLGSVALYAAALLGVCLLACQSAGFMARRVAASPLTAVSGGPWYAWSLLAAMTVVPVLSPLWLAAWKQQPLAIGALDEPESNVLRAPTVALRGWTMDPFGPTRAYAIVNNAVRLSPRPWRHPVDPAGAGLARAFPTYRDPAGARFEIIVDTTPFGREPVSVRTYAINRDGVSTEIDRRVLIPPTR